MRTQTEHTQSNCRAATNCYNQLATDGETSKGRRRLRVGDPRRADLRAHYLGKHVEYGNGIAVCPTKHAERALVGRELFRSGYVTFYPASAAVARGLAEVVGHLPCFEASAGTIRRDDAAVGPSAARGALWRRVRLRGGVEAAKRQPRWAERPPSWPSRRRQASRARRCPRSRPTKYLLSWPSSALMGTYANEASG